MRASEEKGVIRRLIIVGIDGLDYDLIVGWELKHLLQRDYGRITVPISDKGIPLSPQVWGSFLKGEYLNNNFKFEVKHRNNTIYNILRAIRRVVPLSLGLSKRIHKPIEHSRFPELNFKTFIDFPGVREVNAPYYSFDYKSFEISFKYRQGILSINDCIAGLEKILLNKQKLIIKEMEEDDKSKVIFFFIHALDVLQHFIFVKGPKFLRRYYAELDNFLYEVNKIGDDRIIVVSDHGFDFETGTHSMTGFYSCNEVIKPKPKDITDFYGIVRDFLQKVGG